MKPIKRRGDLNVKYMRYFNALAEMRMLRLVSESFGKLAPNTSGPISTFEASMGKLLFRREGGKLVLTPAGERLFERTREICRLIDELERDLIEGKVF